MTLLGSPDSHPGMKLLCITREPRVAQVLERCGVDWVFVDLEVMGKADRQAGRNTVISAHSVEDVAAVRAAISTARLLVRINPWGEHSRAEVDAVIAGGADIVMLPFFTSASEVAGFVEAVNGRAEVCLLLETPEGVNGIDEILEVPGVDAIHVGLNDLHIASGMSFMFEPLTNGTVETLCQKFGACGVKYGFGGMARIGRLVPPAEQILAEHYRLGSSMVILSRSFCDLSAIADLGDFETSLAKAVGEIRECEEWLRTQDEGYFESNRRTVVAGVGEVVRSIRARNS